MNYKDMTSLTKIDFWGVQRNSLHFKKQLPILESSRNSNVQIRGKNDKTKKFSIGVEKLFPDQLHTESEVCAFGEKSVPPASLFYYGNLVTNFCWLASEECGVYVMQTSICNFTVFYIFGHLYVEKNLLLIFPLRERSRKHFNFQV